MRKDITKHYWFRMDKVDRYIILASIGIVLLSFTYIVSKVHEQNVQRENMKIAEYKESVDETVRIHIWRKYHEEQMALMEKVLEELKQNKNQNITPVSTKCL